MSVDTSRKWPSQRVLAHMSSVNVVDKVRQGDREQQSGPLTCRGRHKSVSKQEVHKEMEERPDRDLLPAQR